MIPTVIYAKTFLKNLGINHDLDEAPFFDHKGVSFSYAENSDGVGSLCYISEVFGLNPYTCTAIFCHGAAVRVKDSDGKRSTKAAFRKDLETSYTA